MCEFTVVNTCENPVPVSFCSPQQVVFPNASFATAYLTSSTLVNSPVPAVSGNSVRVFGYQVRVSGDTTCNQTPGDNTPAIELYSSATAVPVGRFDFFYVPGTTPSLPLGLLAQSGYTPCNILLPIGEGVNVKQFFTDGALFTGGITGISVYYDYE